VLTVYKEHIESTDSMIIMQILTTNRPGMCHLTG